MVNGNNLRDLGICHQQAFSRNSGDGISAKYAILRKVALLVNLQPSDKRNIINAECAVMDYTTTKEAADKWGIADRRYKNSANQQEEREM